MTLQAPDWLHDGDVRHALLRCPPILPPGDPRWERCDFVSQSTANARGYTASWALRQGRLFLDHFGGAVSVGDDSSTVLPIGMADVHDVTSPIPATWISADLSYSLAEDDHSGSRERVVRRHFRRLRVERSWIVGDDIVEVEIDVLSFANLEKGLNTDNGRIVRSAPTAPAPARRPAAGLAKGLPGASGASTLPIANLLWHTGPADLEVLLPGLISSVDNKVWRWIAYALGRIGAEAAPAIPVLLKVLRETTNADTMKAAAYALAGIGLPAAPQLPTIIVASEARWEGGAARQVYFLLDQLKPWGPILVEPLLAGLLATREPSTRNRIAYVLGRLGTAAIRPLMQALIVAETDTTRAGIARALAEVGPNASLTRDALLSALDVAGDDARASIGYALRTIGVRSTAALTTIRQAFRSAKKEHALMSLAGAMATVGFEAVDSLIEEFAIAKTSAARRALASALGQIGSSAAAATGCLATEAETTHDPELLVACAEALCAIGAAPQVTATVQIAALRAVCGFSRETILKAMVPGDVPSAVAITDLVQLVAETGRGAPGQRMVKLLGAMGEAAIDPIAAALRAKPTGEGLLLLIQALGLIGTPARVVTDLIVGILLDASEDISRHRIAESLEQIGSPPPSRLDDLLEVFDRSEFLPLRWRVAIVIAGIGAPAIKPLVHRLETASDDDTRRALANALGRLGVQAAPAGPALLAAMQVARSPSTRNSLAAALRRTAIRGA